MILASEGGRWVMVGEGVQCPYEIGLYVKVELLSEVLVISEAQIPKGPLPIFGLDREGSEECLYVTFSLFSDVANPALRYAAWTPALGWITPVSLRDGIARAWGRPRLAHPPVCAPLGLMLGDVALGGRNPSPEVAGWLAEIFADPASLVLALQVMES
jgi:hypothetical protein